MKTLVRNLVVLIALSAALLSASRLPAQEWSAAQREVWKTVETYWGHIERGELEQFMSYIHEDYFGWYNRSAFPNTKAECRRFNAHDFKTIKVLVQTIRPVGIKIHGQVAFVHFYYVQIIRNAEGKEQTLRGRWTDILMKQGDKWQCIGDHGGPEATEK